MFISNWVYYKLQSAIIINPITYKQLLFFCVFFGCMSYCAEGGHNVNNGLSPLCNAPKYAMYSGFQPGFWTGQFCWLRLHFARTSPRSVGARKQAVPYWLFFKCTVNCRLRLKSYKIASWKLRNYIKITLKIIKHTVYEIKKKLWNQEIWCWGSRGSNVNVRGKRLQFY